MSRLVNGKEVALTTMAGIVLLLLLATGLRFYRLDTQSFWNDEGNSARLSERSPALIIEGTASDIHPPLYYLLLRGWRELLGDTEFGLRSFSAFAGVLTVAAVITLASLILGTRQRWGVLPTAVLISGVLAALNPALIYYSQETRMYALMALLATLATLFLWRWLAAPQLWPWAVAYVLAMTAGLYTHYFFPVIFILHGLVVFLWIVRYQVILAVDPQRLRPARLWRHIPFYWFGMVVASFVLYTPWIPTFLRQAGGRPAVREPFLAFLLDSIGWMALGETANSQAQLWVVLLAALLIAYGAVVAGGKVVVPVLGTIIPILFMAVVGTTQPAFYKFMLVAVPFYVIALASSFVPDNKNSLLRGWFWLPWLLLIGVLLATAISLNNLYFDPSHARADYRGIAARIAAQDYPDAGIILDAPNQWEVFTYYHQGPAPVYPLPKGQPDPDLLHPQLAEIAAQHNRLYALYWGEDQRDPDRIVERWLDAHAFKAKEEWIGDVRLVVYAVPEAPPTRMDTISGLSFGDAITLEGFTLPESQTYPGDIVPVTLFWSTARPLPERYKVFLHLVDADAMIVTQRDSEPGGGLVPTTSWLPEDVVVDNHGLLIPQSLPPGEYDLLLGLYDVRDSAQRLPLGPGGRPDHSYLLGKIHVR